MNILGITAYYHDSSAALLQDGNLVAAAQEERFSRIKHDQSYPQNAIAYCLAEGGINSSQVDIICFHEKPLHKFERILMTYLSYAPKGFNSFRQALPPFIKQKLPVRAEMARRLEGFGGRVVFAEHHESHAAAAFFPSPFKEAAILTIDGVGEWTTTSFGHGNGNNFELTSDIQFPHSLGLLYSAFTYYIGFKVNSGEYKVMGLAPYGEPTYTNLIMKELIDVKQDGSFRLNMDYFNYCAGLTMTNARFHALFGGPPRKPETPLTQREMDLARSVQEVAELVIMRMARHVSKETGSKYLCMGGGVALNCVANGKLLAERIFENIWIQPAAGDAGSAVGCALSVWHRMLGKPREMREMNVYLGPRYVDDEIEKFLVTNNLPYKKYDPDGIYRETAGLLARQKVVGWFNGRMEFGPRALGSRSILGDPRDAKMQTTMNHKIKFRESFRPFAPAVLREQLSEYFDLDADSPFMSLVAPVAERKRIEMTEEQNKLFGIEKLDIPRSVLPAVTHVDYSARIQTVTKQSNPDFYRLLREFYLLTGCPALINTSFNVRGEPIVRDYKEAYACFMRTDMDYLVLGGILLDKSEQSAYEEDFNWKTRFVLD